MKEMAMIFEELTQPSNHSKELGKRSKLGGEPNWIQNDEIPKCPKCNKHMTFICQIDSIGYTGSAKTTGEYMFGDVGMFYNFFCFNCGEASVVFQEH
jgi:uncharacterized protein YwqG